jgi:hypothetical protein
MESTNTLNIKSNTTVLEEATASFSIKAGSVVAIDGSLINENGGASSSAGSSNSAGSAENAEAAEPVGERDT